MFRRQIRRQEINTPLKHEGWRGLENANSCFDALVHKGYDDILMKFSVSFHPLIL